MSEKGNSTATTATMLIGSRTLSYWLGLGARQIQLLEAKGVIVQAEKRGTYDAATTMRRFSQHMREEAKRNYSGDAEFSRLRNEKLATAAALSQLELARRRGELVEGALVDREIMQLLSTIKNHMRALPSKISSLLVGVKTRQQAHGILKKYVDLTLREASEFDTMKLRQPSQKNGANDHGRTKRKAKSSR